MLSEFDFQVVHKPGVDNEMDCLSRFPQETRDSTGVRQEGDLEEAAVLAWPAASCLAWAGANAILRVTQAPGPGDVDGKVGSGSPDCSKGAAVVAGAGPGVGARRMTGGQAQGAGAAEADAGRAVSVAVTPAQDVWQDAALLALLRGQAYPLGCGRQERDRLQHRTRGFEWRGTHLVRRLSSGEVRVVLELAARGPLIRDVHERGGHHVGVMKT
jgi:hypothetical protein